MPRKCSVCSLPADLLADINQALADSVPVPQVRAMAIAAGHTNITEHMITRHRGHMAPPQAALSVPQADDKTVRLSSDSLDSTQAAIAVLKASLQQADRLQALALRSPNLRAERLLSEVLSSAFHMLMEVQYDAAE